MPTHLDPFHPSADGKGQHLLSTGLVAIGFVVGLIVVLWQFDHGSSAGAGHDHIGFRHLLWGTPIALIVYLLGTFVASWVAGHAAGLRRIPFRKRVGVPILNGIGSVAYFAIWIPPDDQPSRRRYWAMLAISEGIMVLSGLLAIGLGAVLWRHGLWRDFLLVYAAICLMVSGATLARGKQSAPLTRGDIMLRVSTDGPSSVALDAIGRLAGQASKGLMIDQWDTSLVVRLLEVRDGSMLHLQCLWLAHLHYVEAGEFSQGDELLNEAMELAQLHNAKARAWVMVEGAYSQALRGDAVHARQIMAQIDVKQLNRLHLPLFNAALAINEGRKDDFHRALTTLRQSPQNPYLAREIAQLEARAADRFKDGQDG